MRYSVTYRDNEERYVVWDNKNQDVVFSATLLIAAHAVRDELEEGLEEEGAV